MQLLEFLQKKIIIKVVFLKNKSRIRQWKELRSIQYALAKHKAVMNFIVAESDLWTTFKFN